MLDEGHMCLPWADKHALTHATADLLIAWTKHRNSSKTLQHHAKRLETIQVQLKLVAVCKHMHTVHSAVTPELLRNHGT